MPGPVSDSYQGPMSRPIKKEWFEKLKLEDELQYADCSRITKAFR